MKTLNFLSKILFCGYGLFPASQLSAQTQSPNVLLFVTDDLGIESVGCYGNQVIKTQAIDQLAKEGVKFNNAFCITASCSASRASILNGMFGHTTGHYGHTHATSHFSTFDTVKSLPVILSEGGYHTVRIGKYHLAPESVYKFDEAFSNPGPNARSAVEMAMKCEDVIRKDSDKPFFLYFCTDDPHRMGKRPDLPYSPDGFGNLPQGYPNVTPVKYDVKDVIVPPFIPDNPYCRAEIAQYYESISRLDQGLAHLVKTLKDCGKYNNTLIIFISDNGSPFPNAKMTLYDPGMRLPCIVKEPFAKNRNNVSGSFVSWIDITPTILDYAGIVVKKNTFAGRSFKEDIRNPETVFNETVFGDHNFHELIMHYPMRSIQKGSWKLIVNISFYAPFPLDADAYNSLLRFYSDEPIEKRDDMPENKGENTYDKLTKCNLRYGKRTLKDYLIRPKFELYNLAKDKDEVQNLVYNPDNQDIFKELLAELKKMQKKTTDPWFRKWIHE